MRPIDTLIRSTTKTTEVSLVCTKILALETILLIATRLLTIPYPTVDNQLDPAKLTTLSIVRPCRTKPT